MDYYLAIDLGATSGRHVVGYLEDNQIVLKEVYRFKTMMDNSPDGLIWNIDRLFNEIKIGIKKAFESFPDIKSISIDTWGVDYVLMNNDKEIYPSYAYRNERTQESYMKVHEIICFDELYSHTGIQFVPFNTIYQLYDDLLKGRLEVATDYLMMPSYFVYKLTGVKTHEYTEETTGAFINAITKDYDYELIDKLGLPRKMFGKLNYPGEIVGDLLPEIQKEVGGNAKVVLCASHDTASAFESIDIDDKSIIISSGTWSLLGVKLDAPIVNEKALSGEFSNEGGFKYITFLKNIMGMWISNRIIEEASYTIDFVNERIKFAKYSERFDVNDPSLIAPNNMREAVLNLLKNNPPQNDIDLLSSVYHSMAESYKNAIMELEKITEKQYSTIYIVGGGAKNTFLNNLVRKYTFKKVVPLPIEATSIGSIAIQMKVK